MCAMPQQHLINQSFGFTRNAQEIDNQIQQLSIATPPNHHQNNNQSDVNVADVQSG